MSKSNLQELMDKLFLQLSETDQYILISEAKELLEASNLHEKYSKAQIYKYRTVK
ncbi:MAG: hypothetical protein K5894_09940 [Lachnospiraceae bacterium]|nr:hypothetical protein [Lachnospiraceae bacterium]